VLPEKLGVKREDIYHVSIQPCYDKKLEASRPEFEKEMIKEVDIVLTATEIIDLVKKTEEEKTIDEDFAGILENANKDEVVSKI